MARRRQYGGKLKYRLAIGLLAGLAVISPKSQAQAEGFLGLFGKRKPATVVVGSIAYSASLDELDLTDNLKKVIKTSSILISEQAKPAPGPVELLNRARGDYRRILAAMYANAYYGAEISIMLNGREVSEIPLSATVTQPVQIRYRVRPGPQFHFGHVTVGPLAKPAQPETALKPGTLANSDAIGAAGYAAVADWRAKGRALAKIENQNIVADHNAAKLDVGLDILPGPLTPYGDISVRGQKAVDREFILYMTGIAKGESFDPSKLAQSRKRLARLGVFRSVDIVEADTVSDDGTLPMVYNLTEQAPRKFSLGASVSSSDGINLESFWMHRNLFGKAERLRFDGSISGLGAASGATTFDYNLGATFTKPGVFSRDTNLGLSAVLNRQVISSIDTKNITFEGGLIRFLPDYSIGVSSFATYSQTLDTGGFHAFRLLGFHVDGTRDKRDNVLDPKKGYYLKARFTPFRDYTFGNTGLRTEIEARGYRAFGTEKQTVLAGRVYFGSLAGLGLGQSPTDMLFFSGGGGSVRGYGYQSRGITTGGVFTGGRSVINLNTELRTRLSNNLGLVGFVDAGIIGQGAVPDLSAGVHTGIGIGLRYQTSLGPLRLDIARGLNRVPGDPDFAVYIGLGQAF